VIFIGLILYYSIEKMNNVSFFITKTNSVAEALKKDKCTVMCGLAEILT
jgi:hypothetical protein